MATEQIERPTDVIDLVKREEYSKAAFKSDVVCALVNYIEQLEQQLQDLKDSQIIEVKGDAVLEGDWEFWNSALHEWLAWRGSPGALIPFLVRKRKPEPTKEERFRKALEAHHFHGWTTNAAIDAAKEAGLL